MSTSVNLKVEVTDAAGLGEPLHTVATVFLPDSERLASPPVVAFGFPGAGYSRGYFSFDMPDSSYGGQAGYHVANQGWIFVACDHLGVGESSVPAPDVLTLEAIAQANKATVEHVMTKLSDGSLAAGFPPIADAIRIGMGQSMGGGLTILLQGRDPTFDGVAILGFSAIHTEIPDREGEGAGFDPETQEVIDFRALEQRLRWAFHYSDVPQAIVDADMANYPTRPDLPVWGSATIPPCAMVMRTPGIFADPAAAIDVPVLLASGEIDVVPDPRAEPTAYSNAPDITVTVIPRMAHMHNFASTRTRLWDRIAAWSATVVASRRRA